MDELRKIGDETVYELDFLKSLLTTFNIECTDEHELDMRNIMRSAFDGYYASPQLWLSVDVEKLAYKASASAGNSTDYLVKKLSEWH